MLHRGPIAAVASFGSFIATAGYDNQLILWDSHQRKAIARSLHDHLLNHCAFSSDGRFIVSASSDYTARIWEVPSLRLKTCLSGHTDDVDMAVFSPDDQWVATCALDRTIRIFDLSGQCHKILTGHTGNIISVAWANGGQRLVSSGVDGTVREWNVQSGLCVAIHDMGGVRTDNFAITSDGIIFAGDDQGRIVMIKNKDGATRMQFQEAHQAGIKKIVYDETHQRLITLSYDRTLALWAIAPDHSVQLVRRSDCPSLIWARSAAFIDTHRIALGTFGSQYAIYDAEADVWDLDGVIPDPSLNAVLATRGSQLAIGDAGVLLRNGLPLSNMGSLCNFLVETGGLILTGGQMGRLFDALTGETLYEHHSPLNCAASFMRYGIPHVAVGAYTGEILIFSQEKPGELSFETMLHPYENAVKGLSASHNRLFSVCASTDIVWHDLGEFEMVRRVNKAHERIANGCCRAGDTGFASIGRDRKLRLWMEEGEEVYDTPHPNSIKCISSSSDHNTIVTAAYTGTIATFDMQTRSWTSFERPTASGISSLSYDALADKFWASSYDGHLYGIETQTVASDQLLVQERCA